MVRADASSWNIRDCHMADTLDRLVAHHGGGAKAVVWAHNTHVGDARATDMAAHGMVNVGQLARDRHGEDDVVLVGFAGHHGTVVAADAWGSAAAVKHVPDPPAGTHEDLLNQAVGAPALFLLADGRGGRWLATTRGHRAIGVVYRPEEERRGNWVPTVLGNRYDALLSFDDTTALHPIQAESDGSGGERETFPTGR
jgi:erythromycin esterase